jgi:hypothetical protein
MNLRKAILDEHSKAQTNRIVDWIGTDGERLEALMQLFLKDEYRVVQRSAWTISEVAKMHPVMFQKYLPQLVEKLEDKEAHNAVKRNILRIFDTIEIPVTLHGPIMHHCFETLVNPDETLAARAFSIGILAKLRKIYPEITNEFKMILEDYLQHEAAPSFKSRAKKALKQMK